MEELASFIADNKYLQAIAIFAALVPSLYYACFRMPRVAMQALKSNVSDFKKFRMRALMEQRYYVKRDILCSNLQHFRTNYYISHMYLAIINLAIYLALSYFAIFSINTLFIYEIYRIILKIIVVFLPLWGFGIVAQFLVRYQYYSILGIRISVRKIDYPVRNPAMIAKK